MGTFRQKVQATKSWVKPDPEDTAEATKRSMFARSRKTAGAASAAAPAKRRRKASQPSVTAHRLFPAFAAAWFAALFGLGGLAISGEVLGALVVKLGLPALVPAAAPPLGFTAHVLVAFALTVLGGGTGLLLGLRLRPQGDVQRAVVRAPAPVAEPEVAPVAIDAYKVRARDAHPDAPPRRPLVLTEAFADPLDDDRPGRVAEEAAEAEAPLLRRKPGAMVSSIPAEQITPWIAEFTPGGRDAIEPLDLAALDLGDPIKEPETDNADAEPAFESLSGELQESPEQPREALVPLAEGPETGTAPVRGTVPVAPTLIAATPQLPAGYAATLAEVPNGTRSPVAGAPLENLGLVQLIERLALAMAASKSADESGPATADAQVEPSQTPQADLREEVFAPGPFSMPEPRANPAATSLQGAARDVLLRRLGAMAGDNFGSDGAPPFGRPASRLSSTVSSEGPSEAVVPLHPEQITQQGTAERAAPSLTAAAGAAVPFETDEALRSALATLQRMTARA